MWKIKTKLFLAVPFILILLAGCGTPRFSSLPNNPSSIDVTKYQDSDKNNKTSFTVTGSKMQSLYKSIQDDSKRVLSKNATVSCPTYTSKAGTVPVIWDYHVVIHYPNHEDLSFTQTTNGCTFVKDDQTGALAMGALSGLSPFQE